MMSDQQGLLTRQGHGVLTVQTDGQTPAPAPGPRPERRGLSWPQLMGLVVLAMALGAGATFAAMYGVAGFLDKQHGTGRDSGGARAVPAADEVELFHDGAGHDGLRLTADAVRGYRLRAVAAEEATRPRAMPPQVGTVNFDNDTLFNIRTRFPGEVAEMREVKDDPSIPTRFRPIRAGDTVKQGDLLCVVWSQQLGAAKAALVDAISALSLSQPAYERQKLLFRQGATSLTELDTALRQYRGDSNSLATAERSLLMWKLTPEEMDAIRKEAKEIADLIVAGKVRPTDMANKWPRVEIKVPWFDKSQPDRELTIVEKNTCMNDMLDPIASPAPLFKVADLKRLQIWVHPPEEYLPTLQKNLEAAKKEGRQLAWDIRFQADGPEVPPRKLQIVQVFPQIEPNQHTPTVMGYLDNSDGKVLVGQFVNATILVPPPPNTVEIPSEALNEVGGQALVIVAANAARREYVLRRVPVEARYKDVVLVRSELNQEDEKVSRLEVQQGRRPLEPLRPGDRVITRGVVELTSELESLLIEERTKAETGG
jgi:cobalt-zinc-cadmium efflux system membrane fusion protein